MPHIWYTFFQAVVACQICSQLIMDEFLLQLLVHMFTYFIVMLCTADNYKPNIKTNY